MSAIDLSSNQEVNGFENVVHLAEDMRVQIDLLTTLLHEVAQDQDIQKRILQISTNAGRLWSAANRLAGTLGVDSVANLENRINTGLHALEPIMVGLETFRETAPEIITDLSRAGDLQRFASSMSEWVDVLNQAKALLRSDAPSVAAHIQTLLIALEQWSSQIRVAWDTVNETLPEVIDRQLVTECMLGFTDSIKAWSSVAREARTLLGDVGKGDAATAAHELIGAIREAQLDMSGKTSKRGGLFPFISFLFSGKTLYVLRYVIAVTYRILKTVDQPAGIRNKS